MLNAVPASDQAGFTQGQMLEVNGGFLMP